MSSEAQYSLADFFFTDTADPLVPPPEFGDWARAGAWALKMFEPQMLEAVGPKMAIERGGMRSEVVNLSSYNYLGLATHPEVIAAAQETLHRYGTGACGSPLLSGLTDLHRALEHELAEFTGHEAVILFNSGFGGGVGALTGVLRKNDVALLDAKCHLCLIDGAKQARAKLMTFAHNDAAELDELLEQTEGARRLIVIEGVYSMDGDTARLDQILPVAQKHGVGILLDEAHSILCFGERGRGVVEHYGLPPQAIGLQYATFSKSFAHAGSFVAGPAELLSYMRYYINGYGFSCALPPVVIGGIRAALKVAIRDGKQLRAKLWANVARFREGAESLGLYLGESDSQVFPIIIGGDRQMLYEQCIAMHEAGLFLAPIDYPSVPEDGLRYRVAITAAHEFEHIDRSLEILEQTLVKALRAAGGLRSQGALQEARA